MISGKANAVSAHDRVGTHLGLMYAKQCVFPEFSSENRPEPDRLNRWEFYYIIYVYVYVYVCIYIYTYIHSHYVPEYSRTCPKVGVVRVKRCISIFAPFMPIIAWNWNRSVENRWCACLYDNVGGLYAMIQGGGKDAWFGWKGWFGYSPSARIIFVNRFRFARGILNGRENDI